MLAIIKQTKEPVIINLRKTTYPKDLTDIINYESICGRSFLSTDLQFVDNLHDKLVHLYKLEQYITDNYYNYWICSKCGEYVKIRHECNCE